MGEYDTEYSILYRPESLSVILLHTSNDTSVVVNARNTCNISFGTMWYSVDRKEASETKERGKEGK